LFRAWRKVRGDGEKPRLAFLPKSLQSLPGPVLGTLVYKNKNKQRENIRIQSQTAERLLDIIPTF
jgi:hypothetical protein